MTSTLLRLVSLAAILMVAAACGRQPIGPSGLTAGVEPTIEGLSAKPSGSTTYLTTFGGGVVGAGSLAGSFTGTAGTPGTLRGQVSGTYTWTIEEFLGDCNGNSAGRQELVDRGLAGSAISGTLTFQVDERDSFGERIDFRMTNVTGHTSPDSWEISGHTTITYPAQISGSPSSVSVHASQALIGFRRNPRGKVGADEMITCAVSFSTTLLRQ